MKINIVVSMYKNAEILPSDALPDDTDVPVSSEVIVASTDIAQPERSVYSSDVTTPPKPMKELKHPDRTPLPGRRTRRSSVKAPFIRARIMRCPVRRRIPRALAIQRSKPPLIWRKKYITKKRFAIK